MIRCHGITVLIMGFSLLTACGGASNGTFSPQITAAGVRPLGDVLYSFGAYPDASHPLAGLVAGKKGEFYGASQGGGNPGNGAIFEISAAGEESVIYNFQGGEDGADPVSALIVDKQGALYGTSDTGGGYGCYGPGCGTVFKLTPNQGGWTESVLYRFQGGSDGGSPVAGLLMTKSGALLGTTYGGGSGGGVIFELTPSGSTYSEKVLHEFSGSPDGLNPAGALVTDANGNLYGTTSAGGATTCPSQSGLSGCGTVFELKPSSSEYSYSAIYTFKGGTDGIQPWGTLLSGARGALYGLTVVGGAKNKGTAFELAPKGSRYRETARYSFGGIDGAFPSDSSGLVADGNGNLYGTTANGGGAHCQKRYDGCGTVFTLSPSGKSFTERVLYAFGGSRANDGSRPSGGVLIDRHRNLLGTTFMGGSSRAGTVFSVCCALR